eukprot:1151902-Pelagomonas_calceolata.AAC.2
MTQQAVSNPDPIQRSAALWLHLPVSPDPFKEDFEEQHLGHLISIDVQAAQSSSCPCALVELFQGGNFKGSTWST